jgi:hypothetical protein
MRRDFRAGLVQVGSADRDFDVHVDEPLLEPAFESLAELDERVGPLLFAYAMNKQDTDVGSAQFT